MKKLKYISLAVILGASVLPLSATVYKAHLSCGSSLTSGGSRCSYLDGSGTRIFAVCMLPTNNTNPDIIDTSGKDNGEHHNAGDGCAVCTDTDQSTHGACGGLLAVDGGE